jgi:hypothetical protein
MSDSAGVPWQGRQFEHSASSDDDGSAPERLVEAIRLFRARECGEAEVVDAVRESRLLVPLVARLGPHDASGHDVSPHDASGHDVSGLGARGDKSAELSIVTVSGPDGRNVLPVFSSVAAMGRWNPAARPVPADAVRVALAAASEATELVVLDATSPTEFVIRRPALRAIAQSTPWTPSYLDEHLLREFLATAAPEPAVASVLLAPGDPDARLAGPELVVHLGLVPGLTRDQLDSLLERLQRRWSESEPIASRVDSLRIRLSSVDA